MNGGEENTQMNRQDNNKQTKRELQEWLEPILKLGRQQGLVWVHFPSSSETYQFQSSQLDSYLPKIIGTLSGHYKNGVKRAADLRTQYQIRGVQDLKSKTHIWVEIGEQRIDLC